MTAYNPALLKMAIWKMQKEAVVPPEMMGAGDPAAGGMPMDPAAGGMPMDPAAGGMPMDPAMMGGGAPPMDPAMAGGPPPADPAMAGGAPAPPVGGDPMIQQLVQQVVQETMAATGDGAAAKPKGAGKFDPQQVMVELGYIRKLLTELYTQTGMSLPPDILDTPNEVAAEMEGQGQPKMASEQATQLDDEVSNRGIDDEVAAYGVNTNEDNVKLLTACRSLLDG